MKYLIIRMSLLLGLTVWSLGSLAGAQATQSVKVDVPFEFVFANRTFPAGEYSLETSDGRVLVLRDQRRWSFCVLTNRLDPSALNRRSFVMFDIVNGEHVLTGVTNGETSSAQEVRWTWHE